MVDPVARWVPELRTMCFDEMTKHVRLAHVGRCGTYYNEDKRRRSVSLSCVPKDSFRIFIISCLVKSSRSIYVAQLRWPRHVSQAFGAKGLENASLPHTSHMARVTLNGRWKYVAYKTLYPSAQVGKALRRHSQAMGLPRFRRAGIGMFFCWSMFLGQMPAELPLFPFG